MSTTSLKLPDELRQRAVSAAEELGISPHAFMVNAIRQATHDVEQRATYVTQARQARGEMLEGGDGHAAEDVRIYLRRRIEDGQLGRPAKKPWRE